MRQPEPTVGALILRGDGKLLLAKSPKWKGGWIIPGGQVEEGETLSAAIIREVKEEVGLDVEVVRLLKIQDAVFSPRFYKRRHFIFIDFLCRTEEREASPDGREITECGWFSPEEIKEASLDGYTRNVVEAFLGELPAYNNESGKSE